MATQRHIVQDRRSAGRVKTRLDCKFAFNGTTYNALIREISLTSVSLCSKFMPPHGSEISLWLNAPHLSRPLLLAAKIVRCDCKRTDRGTTSAFVVRISNSSPEFVSLINKLESNRWVGPR